MVALWNLSQDEASNSKKKLRKKNNKINLRKLHFQLVAPEEDPNGAKRFRTVTQLREAIGERFDEVVKEMQRLSNTVMKLSKIYEPSSYKSTLGVKLGRMDVVLGLVKQVPFSHYKTY